MKSSISRARLHNSLNSAKVRYAVRLIMVIAVILILLYKLSVKQVKTDKVRESDGPVAIVIDQDNVKHVYDSQTHPLIFIGGHPRSGTTLMRAMLDAHELVRCGEETRILPHLIALRRVFEEPGERPRLIQGGISDRIIHRAMAAFTLETIAQHGPPPKVLCNKDPLLLYNGEYVSKLFPKSKWLFMVRDGRAVVHSIVTRKITISGYSNNNPEEALESWNAAVTKLDNQCELVGPSRCMKVQYEQLVLHPRRSMEKILKFLNLPWDETVLHHEQFVNKGGIHGIRVSNRERSSDQIIQPINIGALTKWVGYYSQDILDRMPSIAPMLPHLGYDPLENPPIFGEPDVEVQNMTRELELQKNLWEEKAQLMLSEMDKTE